MTEQLPVTKWLKCNRYVIFQSARFDIGGWALSVGCLDGRDADVAILAVEYRDKKVTHIYVACVVQSFNAFPIKNRYFVHAPTRSSIFLLIRRAIGCRRSCRAIKFLTTTWSINAPWLCGRQQRRVHLCETGHVTLSGSTLPELRPVGGQDRGSIFR